MRMPAARIASIFSSAPPLPPEMIAPAWPMRRPGGAVRPAMKPTIGLAQPEACQNAAASSSAEPPISPIMITPSVCGIGDEHLQRIDELGALDRIAADADAGRLAEAGAGGLGHRLVGERARARDDADLARAGGCGRA